MCHLRLGLLCGYLAETAKGARRHSLRSLRSWRETTTGTTNIVEGGKPLLSEPEGVEPRENRGFTQQLLNAQQLVVFGYPIRSAG